MPHLDDLRIDIPPPRPSRSRPSPLPAVVLILVVAAGAWWFLKDRLPLQQQAASPPATDADADAAPTRAAAPGTLTAGGYLEVIPPGPSVASALIDGRVVELHVKPGDRVSAGQVVARLDDSLLRQDVAVQQSEVELARASLTLARAGFRGEEIAAARAEVARAQSALSKARADLARHDQLFSAGVISAAQHDSYRAVAEQADGDLAAAQSRLALLEAGQRQEEISIHQQRLDAAQAQLGRVQNLLNKTVITAPIDGVVLDTYVQPGGWLNPGGDGEHAGQVCSIFVPDRLQAWVDVNQRDLGAVSLGQPVILTTDVRPDEPLSGTVNLISPTANLQRNTVQVKIAIANPPDYLRPEMSVQVSFLADHDGVEAEFETAPNATEAEVEITGVEVENE